ncbi:MAG: ribose-phosphate pyrophosphokinase [Oscillospiraceae bacterium]|nr:ribose-phosphate pyrophosphokinase [Oscillospiraceae bacterium]
MNEKSRELTILTGNSNLPLVNDISDALGVKQSTCRVHSFSDGEIAVDLYDTVRGSDVFIIQSTCRSDYVEENDGKGMRKHNSSNDNLMELLIMIDACRRASAGRITAVTPYYGYARQDRKAKARDPISAKLTANIITSAGADRLLTLDLHAPQIQGFFDIPVDNLLGVPIFARYYLEKFGHDNPDVVVVSPDVGSVARARKFAERLGVGLAIVDKRRDKPNQSEVKNIIGNVAGKKVILFDDMVDTAGSLTGAATALVEEGGAKEVFACASHGVLSGPAIERVNKSYIEELMFLDTCPRGFGAGSEKINYLSVAKLFADAIMSIHGGASISVLFE